MPRELDGGGHSGGGSFGGGGTGGSGGGGLPGTPTGTHPPIGGPIGENGGVFATSWLLFVPVTDPVTLNSHIGIFDVDSFDDVYDSSEYSYRVEDVGPSRVPTVRRVLLTYRDLGLAKIKVTISGTNDNLQAVSKTVEKQIGNAVPTGKILTALVDVALTCFRPQLTIHREPRAGNVSVIQAVMVGQIEEVTL